jgi:hypothetical protein
VVKSNPGENVKQAGKHLRMKSGLPPQSSTHLPRLKKR